MLASWMVGSAVPTEKIVVTVDGRHYDVTAFAPAHRGGLEILMRYALTGEDCGKIFNRIHGRTAKAFLLTLPQLAERPPPHPAAMQEVSAPDTTGGIGNDRK